MPCVSAKSWPSVRLRTVKFFIRSVVLAVVLSVAGLSSALVICVTGCTDAPVSRAAIEPATPACHETEQADGQTVGSGLTPCAHEPASLVPGAFAFDIRPSLVPLPSIASVLLVANVESFELTGPSTGAPAFVATRRVTALRI